MCDGSADLSAAGRALGFEERLACPRGSRDDPVQIDRLLTYADGKVLLTLEGVPLARVVAAVFDTYLRDRHSAAPLVSYRIRARRVQVFPSHPGSKDVQTEVGATTAS
jgi:hypothetical protein